MSFLKEQYNELLVRERRGEEVLDDPVRTPEEIEKWMPEFKKILGALNNTLAQIGSYSTEEVLNGFNLEKVEG